MHYKNNYALALTVSLGGFLFGFDASVISGVVKFITPEFGLSHWQVGLVVAAPTLGGIIAASTVSPLSDTYGRKPILVIIAALYTISAAFSAFAPNYESLVIARFIGGLGFGSLGLAPIYLAEIARPETRGRTVSFNQLNIVIGFAAAYFLNYGLLLLANNPYVITTSLGLDTHLWRWMLGIELIPALVYLILLTRIPESPRWLAAKGKSNDAIKIAQQLSLPEETISVVESKTPFDLKTNITFLFSKQLRPFLLLGCLLAITQQITGINAIYFYAPTIFEQSGVGTNAAFSQATWIGLINLACTVIAMSLIDRLGRKPLLIIGLCGIIVSMGICAYEFQSARYQLSPSDIASLNIENLGALSGIEYHTDHDFKEALRGHISVGELQLREAEIIQAAININAQRFLFGILLFVASFAISLGPVMWVLLPELFPDKLRGVGMAVTGLLNSLTSFFVQLVFPWEINSLGASTTFFIYGSFALIALVFIVKFLPETKGKVLTLDG